MPRWLGLFPVVDKVGSVAYRQSACLCCIAQLATRDWGAAGRRMLVRFCLSGGHHVLTWLVRPPAEGSTAALTCSVCHFAILLAGVLRLPAG
jgi:hypothetical protein